MLIIELSLLKLVINLNIGQFMYAVFRHSVYFARTEDTSSYFPLYKAINRYILDRYAVIYAVEDNPSKTLRQISNTNKVDKVEIHVEGGTLNIIAKDDLYSAARITNMDSDDMLISYWKSLVSDVKRRSNCEKVLMISYAKTFFDTTSYGKLLAFEDCLCKNGSTFLNEAICCFLDDNSVSQMPMNQIVSCLSYHHNAIHAAWQYVPLQGPEIARLVSKGIDKALGEGTSDIILKTLRTVHGIDPEAILEQAGKFEDAIRRTVKIHSQKVIDSISEEIRSGMQFKKS